jgi:hypothetical protein
MIDDDNLTFPQPPADALLQKEANERVVNEETDRLRIGSLAFERLPDSLKYPAELRQSNEILRTQVNNLAFRLERKEAEVRDLGSYRTSARYLRITCIACSLLTAVGAFLAGTEKPYGSYPRSTTALLA